MYYNTPLIIQKFSFVEYNTNYERKFSHLYANKRSNIIDINVIIWTIDFLHTFIFSFFGCRKLICMFLGDFP